MAVQFLIRPFVSLDLEPLRTLRNEIIRDTHFIYENEIWDTVHAAHWFEELTRDGRIAITAESCGQFIGCCYASYFRRVSASRGIAEISVYITQEYRRAGIAHALVTEMEGLLAKQNFFGMMAVIDSENSPAIQLFEDLDFRTIGDIHQAALLRGSWRTARMMHKQIPT